MTRRWGILIILLFTVFSAIPLYCQDDNMKTVDGRVVSVDPQGFQIVVKAIDNMTFSVAPDANITNQDGIDVELANIKSGNYVMIDYYDNRSGGHIAKNIDVEYNR